MGKKINQLDASTSAEVKDPSRLFPLADPITGIAKSASLAQLAGFLGVWRYKYTATGEEGTSFNIGFTPIPYILMVTREAAVLHLSDDDSPDGGEYYFDNTTGDMHVGITINPGERFTFLYTYAND